MHRGMSNRCRQERRVNRAKSGVRVRKFIVWRSCRIAGMRYRATNPVICGRRNAAKLVQSPDQWAIRGTITFRIVRFREKSSRGELA
jgi:hypothetical protein